MSTPDEDVKAYIENLRRVNYEYSPEWQKLEEGAYAASVPFIAKPSENSLVRTAVLSYNPVSQATKSVMQWWNTQDQNDPEFDPVQVAEDKKLGNKYSGTDMSYILNSGSAFEMDAKLARLDKEHRDAQILEASGWSGTLAGFISEVVNPLNYAVGIGGVTGLAGKAGAATTPALGLRGMVTGAVAGAETMAVQAAVQNATNPTYTVDRVAGDILGGMVFGTGFGKLGAFDRIAEETVAKNAAKYHAGVKRENIKIYPDVTAAPKVEPTATADVRPDLNQPINIPGSAGAQRTPFQHPYPFENEMGGRSTEIFNRAVEEGANLGVLDDIQSLRNPVVDAAVEAYKSAKGNVVKGVAAAATSSVQTLMTSTANVAVGAAKAAVSSKISNPFSNGIHSTVKSMGDSLYKVHTTTPGFNTTFDTLWNSGSVVARVFAQKMTESAAGINIRNPISMPILADIWGAKIAAPVLTNYDNIMSAWKRTYDPKGLLSGSEARLKFHHDFMMHQQAVWFGDVANESQDYWIRKMAKYYDEGAATARKWHKGEGNQIAVKGAEDLPDRPGWTAMRWSQTALDTIRHLAAKSGQKITDADVIAAIHAGYRSVWTVGELSDKTVAALSKAVVDRMRAMDHGIDTHAVGLLNEEGTDFLVSALERNGLSRDEALSTIEKIKGAQTNKRTVGILKHRTEIDLRIPIGNTGYTLVDLMNHDLNSTWLTYSHIAGKVGAAARNGIQVDELHDWVNAIQDELHARNLPAIDDATANELKGLLSGKPINMISETVRRAVGISRTVLLNAMGAVQLGETGAQVGMYGFRTFLQSASSVTRGIVNRITHGGASASDHEMIKQMAAWNVGIHGENAVFRPELFIDELRSKPAYKHDRARFAGALVDRGLVSIGALQRKLNLFDAVHKWQHLANVRAFCHSMADINKFSPQRLEDMGFDDIMVDKIKNKYFKRDNTGIVEFADDGFVTDLHPDKWDSDDWQQFVVIQNRVSSQVIQKSYYGESNALYHNDIGYLMTDLKNFTLLAAQKQSIRSLRLADDVSAAQAIWGLVTGTITYAAREAISGKEDKNTDPMQIIKGGLMYANMTAAPATFGDPILAMAGVDSAYRFSNFARPGAGLTGDIIPGIASFDTINKMAHAPESILSIMVGSYDRADVSAAQTLPIINNLYGFQYAFNRIKADLDNKSDAEKALAEKKRRAVEGIVQGLDNAGVTLEDMKSMKQAVNNINP